METITTVLTVIVQLSGLIFVVASMLSMGLSLTVPQIIEPLKNVKLVVLALVANFIIIPILALILVRVIPALFGQFPEDATIAFILLATAAGAPFLPKLAQLAKGNIAFSVGLMVLLMVVTIFFLPIALPLLLPGVEVDSWEIAKSLIITMLVPLGIGLFIKSRYADIAPGLQKTFGQASNTALMLMMGVLLVVNFNTVLSTIGTGVIIAGVIFYLVAVLIGYLLALGGDKNTRNVMGLGAGQRNISAALVVAAGNFADRPDVMIALIVLAIVDMVLLLPLAGEIGKRMGDSQTAEAEKSQRISTNLDESQ